MPCGSCGGRAKAGHSGYSLREQRGARPAKCLTCGLRFNGDVGYNRAREHVRVDGHIVIGIPDPDGPSVAGAEGAQESFGPRTRASRQFRGAGR